MKMDKALRLDKGQIEVLDNEMAKVLSKKTPAERIRIGFDIWLSSRNMLMTYLRKSHPEWSEDILIKEIAKRLSHGAV